MSGQQLISSTLISSYTSLGYVPELLNPELIQHNILATTNTSSMSDEYKRQLNELRSMQHKLESIKTSEIQHHEYSRHGANMAYSALVISIIAIIVILCTTMLRKKSRIVQIADMPHHETSNQPSQTHDDKSTPVPTPRQSFTIQV